MTAIWDKTCLRYFQHFVLNGPCQAVDQHVRQDEGGGHCGHDGRLRAHPLLGLLVEEERVGADVRGDSVLRHDVVQHQLHPLRQGRRLQVRRQSRRLRNKIQLKSVRFL